MARRFVLAMLLLIVPAFARAQAPGAFALENRLINLPTQVSLGAGTIQVVFTHRFSETVQDGGARDLWGLDSAADIGIGAEIGLGHGIEAELYRSSFFKQLEGSVKWSISKQGDLLPFALAVRAGGEYRAASGVDTRTSAFAQVVLGFRIGTLDLFAVPMFASDTPTLRNAANVGLGAAYHLPGRWDVAAEVVPRNRDAKSGTLAWSIGLAKRVRGHEFMIYAGNSRATTTDLLVGTDLPGGYKRGDVRLGFNLLRRFPE